MVSDWIDHIELRRSRAAVLSVWANKYGEDPDTGRRRWLDWAKSDGLKTPSQVMGAILDNAQLLDVEIDWVAMLPLIATVDWLTAAVIAEKVGQAIPTLPKTEDLLAQRSFRSFGRVRIDVEWGYDLHDLSMTLERWLSILGGRPYRTEKKYWYEGAQYTGCWHFKDRQLEVTYDDGGVGWIGDLASIDVLEGPTLDGVDIAKVALVAASA